MRLTGPCRELRRFLDSGAARNITFDVVGGCGIDMSLGANPCMSDAGVWFCFCPFCGARIVHTTDDGHAWWEAVPNVDKIANDQPTAKVPPLETAHV